MTVPTAAIQRGSPGATPGGAMGTYVYLINANSTVSVRQITVGPTYIAPHNVSMTTVDSGLSAGDHVVTDGADRLRDGLRVSVTTIDGKPVAPTAASDDGHRTKGQGAVNRNGKAAAPANSKSPTPASALAHRRNMNR